MGNETCLALIELRFNLLEMALMCIRQTLTSSDLLGTAFIWYILGTIFPLNTKHQLSIRI